MSGSFRIAEGYVEVTADETAYDRAMARLRSKRTTVQVGVQLDDRDAIARLDRFARDRIITARVRLDRTALAALDRTIKVDISPDLNQAAVARVTKALDRLTQDRMVRILASADTRVAADEIRNLVRRQRVRIGVDVDTRVAADDIANLTRRRTLQVTANANTAEARARIDALTRDRHMNVHVGLDQHGGGGGMDMGGGMGILSTRIAQIAAAAIAALPTLASLGQSLAAMGPAAAIAAPAVLSLGAAFAAIKIGTSGMGDAFKAAFAPAVKTAGAAESATRRVESAQRSLAKAQQAVKDAEVNAAAARVKAARDIRDAQLNLKNTVSDVADANRRAAESVASAERDLAQAQKAARQAQLDLTQARKDAAEQLVDLNNQLTDSELDHREAVLRLQQAQDNLNKVMADPTATQQQRDEAQLTYDEAQQHLKEQEIAQQRLKDKVDAANKAGVEGSDQVTKAKQGVADADRDIIDKTRDLKDAEIEAARAQEAGAQRVAKAQRDVADAQAALTKAVSDGARQVADAQQAAADAARAFTQAQESSALGTNKLAAAMARLSPNARAFVQAVIDQRNAWTGLKLDVQNALFAGLGRTFTNLSTAVLPSLRGGLVGMAGILNTTAKNAANAVIQLGKTGLLKEMFSGLNGSMKPLTKIPGQIITGLTQISIAASPGLKRLNTAVAGAADRISKKLADAFKSGRMEQAIDTGLKIAKQFGQLIGDIFGTLGNVMKAAAKGGGDALGGLGAAFKELRRITALPEVQKALTSIFTAINAIAKLFATTLGAVLQAALPLLAAMAPVVTQLANDLGPLLAGLASSLGSALMPVITALMPLIGTLGDVLIRAVRAMMPLLQPIGDLVAAILQALEPAFAALLPAVIPVIDALVTALVPVVTALIPIVRMAGKLLAQLAPIFPPLVNALLPLLPPVAQLVQSLLNLAVQVLTPLMPLIVGLANALAGTLAGAIGILVPALTTVIGWITKFVDAITKGVQWVVDKFRWLYDTLVGHSIIPDLVKAIIGWFGQLWDRVKKIFTGLGRDVIGLWRSLWSQIRSVWTGAWDKLRNGLSGAWGWVRNSFSGLRTSLANTWSGMWNSIRDKASSIFGGIRSKLGDFKNGVLSAFRGMRDSLGSIWNGIKSKLSTPVKWVVGNVYNQGIRRMWNTIAGKINSHIQLPAIKLGFNTGGIVPGRGNRDTVPAMLTPGERILSNQQVTRLGGHRAIDAMLGHDRPTGTGGNPNRRQEKTRQAHQAFASGGIVGTISDIGKKVGGAVTSGLDWAKNLVVGGLKAAAQKAIAAIVQPLINRIPGGGFGNLLKGMSSKALSGMLGFLGNEDKKAAGGPAVQKALAWARTQAGLPYQWAGNGNPSWDCSGLMSALESVIRGERPHRRWATGSFSGATAPPGWVRNLQSPFMIGITNAGVGHTAGTLAGVNVESRGGDGVLVGSKARGYNDRLFTDRYGFRPATTFDNGGLLAPGATLAVNGTGRPERTLSAQHTAKLDALLANAAAGVSGGVTVNMTVNSLTIPSAAERKQFAQAMAKDINEAIRLWNRRRA